MRVWSIILAVSTLMGTIIGAGIFALPYSAAQSGFLVFSAELALLFLVILFLHLFYGEVVAKTPGKHRLVGYVEKYLGKKAKKIVFVNSIFEFYGTLLIFSALGGQFANKVLNQYFSFDNYFLSSLIFYFFCALCLFWGIKLIASLEFFLSLILFSIILVIVGLLSDQVLPANLTWVNLDNILLPYGIILFALSGASAIPEIKEIIKKSFLKVIFWGTFIPAIGYFLFTLTIVGSLGQQVSKDALTSLEQKFGDSIISWLSIFGLISIFTSFLTIGDTLKKIFWYDLKINHFASWLLTISVPLILFLLKLQDFIVIMSIVGAVAIGIEGAFIVLLHQKIQSLNQSLLEPSYSVIWGNFLRPITLAFLILGMALSIYFEIFNH